MQNNFHEAAGLPDSVTVKNEWDSEIVDKQASSRAEDMESSRQDLKAAAQRHKPPEYPLVEDSARLNTISKKV